MPNPNPIPLQNTCIQALLKPLSMVIYRRVVYTNSICSLYTAYSVRYHQTELKYHPIKTNKYCTKSLLTERNK